MLKFNIIFVLVGIEITCTVCMRAMKARTLSTQIRIYTSLTQIGKSPLLLTVWFNKRQFASSVDRSTRRSN